VSLKSGEFSENGTMRRFPGPYRIPFGFFTTWKKIRANRRNWEAKVLQRPTGARIQKGGTVLGSPVIGVFRDPGSPQRRRKMFYRKFSEWGHLPPSSDPESEVIIKNPGMPVSGNRFQGHG
jgi:hypothetical protein